MTLPNIKQGNFKKYHEVVIHNNSYYLLQIPRMPALKREFKSFD